MDAETVIAPKNWILIRGWTHECRHWAQFPRILQDRVACHNVFCFNLPGTGDRHQEASPKCISDMTDSLRAQYLRTKESKNTTTGIVSISMGGMIALDWACRYPTDFQKLVIINSSLKNLSPCWQRLQPKIYLPLMRAIFTSDPSRRELLVLSLVSSLAGRPREEAARLWNLIASECAPTKQTIIRQLMAAAKFRFNSSIPIPSLILASQSDRLVHPDCSRAVARLLNSELRLHPTAGHDLPLDDPSWVAEQISQWLHQAPA